MGVGLERGGVERWRGKRGRDKKAEIGRGFPIYEGTWGSKEGHVPDMESRMDRVKRGDGNYRCRFEGVPL